MNQDSIFQLIGAERDRQDRKWGANRHQSSGKWLAILTEEFGEVGKAILEGNKKEIVHELIQCAAVAVAWIEDLSREEVKR